MSKTSKASNATRLQDNLLLAALPEDEKRRLAPFLTTVEMKLGQTLIEHDTPMRYIWFPINAITSTIQLFSGWFQR